MQFIKSQRDAMGIPARKETEGIMTTQLKECNIPRLAEEIATAGTHLARDVCGQTRRTAPSCRGRIVLPRFQTR
jgi:hypothetical protein